MTDAETMIADPTQEIRDAMDYLPEVSAASRSTARTDIGQPDGSIVVIESHDGGPATLGAEPAPTTD